MLHVMRKLLLGRRSVTPGLDPDFLSNLGGEAFGPVAARVVFHYSFDCIGMHIFVAVAHIVCTTDPRQKEA
jgi:hypothetical protein